MGKLGPLEIVLIFVVVLIVFGPSKLPQIGAAIGKGIKEFRNASKEMKSQLEANLESDTTESK